MRFECVITAVEKDAAASRTTAQLLLLVSAQYELEPTVASRMLTLRMLWLVSNPDTAYPKLSCDSKLPGRCCMYCCTFGLALLHGTPPAYGTSRISSAGTLVEPDDRRLGAWTSTLLHGCTYGTMAVTCCCCCCWWGRGDGWSSIAMLLLEPAGLRRICTAAVANPGALLCRRPDLLALLLLLLSMALLPVLLMQPKEPCALPVPQLLPLLLGLASASTPNRLPLTRVPSKLTRMVRVGVRSPVLKSTVLVELAAAAVLGWPVVPALWPVRPLCRVLMLLGASATGSSIVPRVPAAAGGPCSCAERGMLCCAMLVLLGSRVPTPWLLASCAAVLRLHVTK